MEDLHDFEDIVQKVLATILLVMKECKGEGADLKQLARCERRQVEEQAESFTWTRIDGVPQQSSKISDGGDFVCRNLALLNMQGGSMRHVRSFSSNKDVERWARTEIIRELLAGRIGVNWPSVQVAGGILTHYYSKAGKRGLSEPLKKRALNKQERRAPGCARN